MKEKWSLILGRHSTRYGMPGQKEKERVWEREREREIEREREREKDCRLTNSPIVEAKVAKKGTISNSSKYTFLD